VRGFKQIWTGPRSRLSIAITAAGFAGSLLANNLVALAQDQSAATTNDVIFARKTMMSSISDNMDQIETMISTAKIDIADAHEHADTISVMLMAFPHLFPPASNQWKPGVDIDPVSGTFASPDAWSKFPDFYQRAADASKIAFDMSRADKPDDLKAGAKQLRIACNACHAAYLKTQ
jgi:cytochrome c556